MDKPNNSSTQGEEKSNNNNKTKQKQNKNQREPNVKQKNINYKKKKKTKTKTQKTAMYVFRRALKCYACYEKNYRQEKKTPFLELMFVCMFIHVLFT